jgi:hypothetical protein
MVSRTLGCRSHRDLLVEGRGEQVVRESRTLKILD